MSQENYSPAGLTLCEFTMYVLDRYREHAQTMSHAQAGDLAYAQALQDKLGSHRGTFEGLLSGIKRDDGLTWLAGEMTKVQACLSQIDESKAEQAVKGNAQYLRGLREMVKWVLEKCEHEISWRGLHNLFGDSFPDLLPEHGSSFDFKKREPEKEAKP